MREARQAVDDIEELRHWTVAECWCGEVHAPETPGLVQPPWPVGTAGMSGIEGTT
jgi:hypothetical protein